ncbi:MAG: zinc ribbon domain-containing protein [Candidatus Omnitrophota bacterium]
MPTYEYKCNKCGHSFEKFQAMSDAPVKECPKCHKLTVKRLISGGTGIIFKGSGFYATDYRKKKTDSVDKKSGSGKSCSSCSPAANSCSSCKK